MKKVLLLVMVLCLGLMVVPTKAAVYYELWDFVPPVGTGAAEVDANNDGTPDPALLAFDWVGVIAPNGNLDPIGDPIDPIGELNNFNVGASANTDDYMYRYIGLLSVATAGNYSFWGDGDDGVVIFVDGVLVANFDGLHGGEGENWDGLGDPGFGKTVAPIALSAGPHLIEVFFYERGGGDFVEVRYAMSSNEAVADFIADADLSLPVIVDSPAAWAADVPLSGETLSWSNPLGASQFNVYIGTDPEVADPNLKDKYLAATVDGTSVSLDTVAGGELINDTRYFVRIDTVAEPNNVVGAMFAFDTMRMAPIITGDPVSVSVGTGGCLASMSVTAISGINDDGGDLNFQWYDDSGAVDGEIGDTLVTDAAGTYYCVVSTMWGEATSASASVAIVEFGPAVDLNGLIGYWPFDVDASDASGNGIDGNLTGNAKISAGLFGNALEVDGNTGAMFTGKQPSELGLTGQAPRTVSCWAYTRSWGNRGLYDMGNRSAGQNFSLRLTNNQANRWRVQYWGGPDWDFRTTNGGDFDGMNMAGGYTFDCLNNWVHFVHTVDSSGTKIYGNGVLLVSYGDAIDTQDSQDWRIGVYGGGDEWDGWIDEVSLWSRALTLEEVEALYATGNSGGTLAGPSWKVTDPQYSPALDGNGWFNPEVDLTLSWEKAAVGPCGAGVTYNVIWTTDEAVANDPNAEVYISVSDMQADIAAADMNFEDEVYWRVDVIHEGNKQVGDVFFAKAIKLIPEIVSHPADTFARVGETASFTFEVTSQTEPVTYAWKKEGSDDVVGTEATLEIVVAADSGGMYSCVASNPSGPVASNSARLEVARMVAYYPLDELGIEGEPNFVADASGEGRNGEKFNGVSVVPGVIGNAFSFDGNGGDFVDIGTWNPSDGTGQLTVSMWVAWNPDGGSTWQGPMGKRDTWNGAEMMWQLELSHNNNGFMEFKRNGSGMPGGYLMPRDQSWVHLVQTFDGSNAIMYINGEYVTSGGFSFGSDPTSVMTIGACEAGGGNPWHGLMDDVKVYNYAVTPAEASMIYHDDTGETGLCSERNLLYDFDGNCKVDMADFAMFMEGWMECNLLPCN